METVRIERIRESARRIKDTATDLQLSIIGCVALPIATRNELFRQAGEVLGQANRMIEMPGGEEIVRGYQSDMMDCLLGLAFLLDDWKTDLANANDASLISLAFAAEASARMVREYINAKTSTGVNG